MVDLTTTYLGISLKNPLVASASPLSKQVETVKELEEAGIAAIVMYSLFEEQILHESHKLDRDLDRGTYAFAEALDYLPDHGVYSIGPNKYLEQLRRVKEAVSIPVIGSLNGISSGGWVAYAKKIEDAGADALELNLYDIPIDLETTSSQVEEQHISLVRDIRAEVNIPIAVKISPFYSALPNFAKGLVDAGANGLVLFNRFYQPDFDLEELEVVANLVLSNSHELRLPLRWIAILYGKLEADFALSSGVHNADDIIKAMMAGASVAMSASALLRHGPSKCATLLADVQAWMQEKEYESIAQMKGSMSQQAIAKPDQFERANYMRVLSSY